MVFFYLESWQIEVGQVRLAHFFLFWVEAEVIHFNLCCKKLMGTKVPIKLPIFHLAFYPLMDLKS